VETATVRLIREQYPFPIAYAYKKLQAQLDDDAHKLHLLVQTAEVTAQYLALVILAQLRHDLEHRQAPALGREVLEIPERLRRPDSASAGVFHPHPEFSHPWLGRWRGKGIGQSGKVMLRTVLTSSSRQS
jgi:hypothetical protein